MMSGRARGREVAGRSQAEVRMHVGARGSDNPRSTRCRPPRRRDRTPTGRRSARHQEGALCPIGSSRRDAERGRPPAAGAGPGDAAARPEGRHLRREGRPADPSESHVAAGERPTGSRRRRHRGPRVARSARHTGCTSAPHRRRRERAAGSPRQGRGRFDDDQEFQRAIWQLHERIADIGANRVLQTVYRGVLAYVEANAQNLPAGPTTPAQRRKRLRIHQQLVESIIEQDEKACRRAIRAHESEQHLPR